MQHGMAMDEGLASAVLTQYYCLVAYWSVPYSPGDKEVEAEKSPQEQTTTTLQWGFYCGTKSLWMQFVSTHVEYVTGRKENEWE